MPGSVYECADWPPPPADADSSEAYVAAWLETEVYPAFMDCKDKLETAKALSKKSDTNTPTK
jgi:hypothetical protein